MESQIQKIFTDKIDLPLLQMRTTIDRDELHELADDIKKNGLISPITVRPIHKIINSEACQVTLENPTCANVSHNRFELVAGQRRYMAHQIAGILEIRAVVRELTDDAALAIMTSENLARASVNPVDEANHVGRLMILHNSDVSKVAAIVSRGEQWVKDRLAISLMPEALQDHLRFERMKLGVALILSQITEDVVRELWVELAVRDGVSIAQARYWYDGWKLSHIPGVNSSTVPQEGYDANGRSITKLECAVDLKKYDARQFKCVMIHESNYPLFMSVCMELRNLPADTDSSAGAD